MKIEELRLHPIKSTSHINVDQCDILSYGLRHDRQWALFATDGQVITSRTHPKLLDITCQISNGKVSFSYEDVQIVLPPYNHRNYNALQIFSYDAHGYEVSTELNDWFSNYLGQSCKLIHVAEDRERPVLNKHGGQSGDKVGFGDQAPILILSKGSLDDLNNRLADPLTMDRFRPNIIISGAEAYIEDHWDIIQVGNIKLRVIQQCERCVLTTIDHQTKRKHPKSEPLRTLNKYRRGPRGGVVFGVHAVPMSTGSIYLNDEINVHSKISRPVNQ